MKTAKATAQIVVLGKGTIKLLHTIKRNDILVDKETARRTTRRFPRMLTRNG